MSNSTKAPPLTEEQRERFNTLEIPHENVALMSGFFDGQPAAYIVAVHEDTASGEIAVSPLAILLDAAFVKRNKDRMADSRGNSEMAPPGENLRPFTSDDVEQMRQRS